MASSEKPFADKVPQKKRTDVTPLIVSGVDAAMFEGVCGNLQEIKNFIRINPNSADTKRVAESTACDAKTVEKALKADGAFHLTTTHVEPLLGMLRGCTFLAAAIVRNRKKPEGAKLDQGEFGTIEGTRVRVDKIAKILTQMLPASAEEIKEIDTVKALFDDFGDVYKENRRSSHIILNEQQAERFLRAGADFPPKCLTAKAAIIS